MGCKERKSELVKYFATRSLLFIFTVLAFTWNVGASGFQEYCSNSQATIRTTYDTYSDSESFIYLTKRVFEDQSKQDVVDTTISLPYHDYRVDYTQEKKVPVPDPKPPFPSLYPPYPSPKDYRGWYPRMTTGVIVITRFDDLEWPDHIIGLAKDKKSISTVVMCEMH